MRSHKRVRGRIARQQAAETLKGPNGGSLYACFRGRRCAWLVCPRADELFGVPGMHLPIMVDLTRDENGCLRARLLDAVEDRSGQVYADWLTEPGLEVKATVEHAAPAHFGATRTRSATNCPTPSPS
jgi:hypothetical protein